MTAISPTNNIELSKEEAQNLIQEIKDDFTSIRQKLRLLEEKKGYKALGYQSFDDCCKEEFKDISSRYLERNIAALRTEEALDKMDLRPNGPEISEGVLRPLTTFNEDYQSLGEAYKKADQIAKEENDGKITENITRRARDFVKDKKVEWKSDELERKSIVKSGGTVVANMRTDGDKALIHWAKENDCYQRIDRNSEWGNPYELDQDGDRDTVCDSFEHYFERKYGLHKELHTLKGKVLGCWCYPKRCHGNHLKNLADNTNEV